MEIKKPLVMGVLNLTPDSFSDGGKFFSHEKAIERFEQMVEEGADIIDIGGESTGPGSTDVSKEEELERVIPLLQNVRPRSTVRISIDTYKAAVAAEAIKEGADIINDVLALRGDPAMAEEIAKAGVPVVLMYSKDMSGRTTGKTKEYEDVIESIKSFFDERIKTAIEAGIKRENIILDPGQGMFVSPDPAYSLQILKRLNELSTYNLPLLIGSSRKSLIGQTLNLPLHERLEGSLACAVVAVMHGASIVRVHDVKQTRRAIDMTWAIMQS